MSEMKFEQALKKVEEIVAKLEGGDLSLEDNLKMYEEGVQLIRFCNEKLSEAEKKIEILSKDRDGKLVAKPFKAKDDDTQGKLV